MDKIDCAGCEANFYNGNNDLGVKECWHFDKKKRVIRRFRIPMSEPCGKKSNFVAVRCPPCYLVKGYAYFEKIPEYAK